MPSILPEYDFGENDFGSVLAWLRSFYRDVRDYFVSKSKLSVHFRQFSVVGSEYPQTILRLSLI